MSFKPILLAAAAVAGIGFGAAPSQAVNLVLNGDFSAGNSGFSSDYSFATPPGDPINQNGEYAIVPSTGIQSAVSGFADWTATSTDPSGAVSNLLVADGDSAPVAGVPKRVWIQSIALAANTSYTFSFSGIDVNASNASNAALALLADGVQLTTLATGQSWQSLSYSFTSGLAASVLFAIADNNTSGAFNDFAIDNISLVATATTPIPPAILLFASALGGLGFFGWRRKRAAV